MPRHQRVSIYIHILVVTLVFGLFACAPNKIRRETRTVEKMSSLNPTSKFVKAHMKNGNVYILNHWHYNAYDSTLSGYGELLSINRNRLETRKYSETDPTAASFKLNLTDVALIETNDIGRSMAGGLIVVTGVTVVVGILCLTNPKACFGSCPTFYAYDGDTMAIQAEGFSTSVSPSLEANDIDMLYTAKFEKEFEMSVTNEALETHSIRHANILAFEKKDNERVFATTTGAFYKCINTTAPIKSLANNGDVLNKVSKFDNQEYFSASDSTDINSKEELFVTLSNTQNNKPRGLVIAKRQTLMTTFLMYQGLAYMGRSVSYWMAKLESGGVQPRNGIFSLLGGIEVFSKSPGGPWQLEGTINETGPIATDVNLIPLVKNSSATELKLVMTKGLWRINYLASTEVNEQIAPEVIQPSRVQKINGSEDKPLEKLLAKDQYLVTYPGDEYKISYQLPFDNAELFLDSRGYYLEWIREDWEKEQNLRMLSMMVKKPSKYLRHIAPRYKSIEGTMESTFWNSRYVNK